MLEPLSIVYYLLLLIIVIILGVHFFAMRREIRNLHLLQNIAQRRVYAQSNSLATNPLTEDLRFCLLVHDSKNRRFIFRNINTAGYEVIPGQFTLATYMTSKKPEITLEIIKKNGISNLLESVEITLTPGIDNYVDVADYIV